VEDDWQTLVLPKLAWCATHHTAWCSQHMMQSASDAVCLGTSKQGLQNAELATQFNLQPRPAGTVILSQLQQLIKLHLVTLEPNAHLAFPARVHVFSVECLYM
jgi:hypothetical protein